MNDNDSNKVLSIYLNTDRRSPDQQKSEWKIHLKNALNDLAGSTKYNDSEKEQSKAIIQK